MKILVFGAGAVGSAFGGFLSRFHEVTLLGRPWHLHAIRQRGLQVEGLWGKHRFLNLKLATDARLLFRSQPSFDLILLTVKSYDTEPSARFLRGRVHPQTALLSIQNGIGNIETLQRYLPAKQILAARVIFGVELWPGKIKITVSADETRLGETTTQQITSRVKNLAQIFSKAGVPTRAAKDIQKYLWAKLIYNCALNPLASVLKVHYGALGESSSTRLMMEGVIEEIYRVARQKKIRLEPAAAKSYLRLFYQKLLPRTCGHHPSMLQDLERGRRTEIEALNGAVVRLGKSLSTATPFNELLTELIRSRETQ